MSRFAIVLLVLTAGPVFGGTDVFQKWRTPEGTLYIGDRPPAGSVLLERVELTASEGTPTVISDAAAHGREIMRLRAAEREAARNRELERSLREPVVVPVVDPVPPVVFVGGGGHHHHRRHGGHHRPRLGIGPSPISAVERPNITLVTPDESARRIAPLFPAPVAGPRRRDR